MNILKNLDQFLFILRFSRSNYLQLIYNRIEKLVFQKYKFRMLRFKINEGFKKNIKNN